MDYKIECPVPAQRVADLMVSAIEGGSNYWLGSVTPRYEKHTDYSEAVAYGDDMVERVFQSDDEDEGASKGTLNPKAIEQGLRLLGTIAGGRHLTAFISENDDAETADVFLQLCLFGDVVYG